MEIKQPALLEPPIYLIIAYASAAVLQSAFFLLSQCGCTRLSKKKLARGTHVGQARKPARSLIRLIIASMLCQIWNLPAIANSMLHSSESSRRRRGCVSCDLVEIQKARGDSSSGVAADKLLRSAHRTQLPCRSVVEAAWRRLRSYQHEVPKEP